MFDKDRFIEDCIDAVTEGQGAVRERITEPVADRAGILSEPGAPQLAGITPLYRSADLTIINIDKLKRLFREAGARAATSSEA